MVIDLKKIDQGEELEIHINKMLSKLQNNASSFLRAWKDRFIGLKME